MKSLFILLLVFSARSGSAQAACRDPRWTVVGNLSSEIKSYDALFSDLPKSKDPTQSFNAYLHKNGLLQILSPVGRVKGFPNRLEMDSPSGIIVGAFLKKLTVPAKSGLDLDKIFEVASFDATKALHLWRVPFGSPGPAGIDGDDLFYKDTLTAICSEVSYSATVRVGFDGTYELAKIELPERLSGVSPDKCKAAKILFKNSDYATCAEFIDLKTKKKRILVWELPMT